MRCSYAPLGTFGHECGAPAETILLTVMSEETKVHLRCLGAAVPEDGLARAGRCKAHRGVREFYDGAVKGEIILEGQPECPR